jgi:hypothetical protein
MADSKKPQPQAESPAAGQPGAKPAAQADKPKRKPIPEFKALSRIDVILSELSLQQAYRVLTQLTGRYAEMVATHKPEPEPSQS